MSNIIDYIKWRGDVSFSYSPLNEIDVALFAEFIVPDFDGIISPSFTGEPVTLGEAVEKYFTLHESAGSELGLLEPQSSIPMIRNMGLSKRFREVGVTGYVIHIDEEKNEQFGALTFLLPDGTRTVVFKPTDDTIIGWKEDCMLAVSDSVPAQKDALSYLLEAAAGNDAPLLIAGHSKGGNLSAYAAIHAPAEIKKRITAVYNFDGPGFNRPLTGEESYQEICDRIFTVRSQHSSVGTLMNEPGTVVTVVSTAQGPQAHDPFTWEVLGTGYVRDPAGQSAQSRKFETAMKETLEAMDDQSRVDFITELFNVLSAGGAKTLSDLKSMSLPKLNAMRKMLVEGSELQSFFNRIAGEYLIPDAVKKLREKKNGTKDEKE